MFFPFTFLLEQFLSSNVVVTFKRQDTRFTSSTRLTLSLESHIPGDKEIFCVTHTVNSFYKIKEFINWSFRRPLIQLKDQLVKDLRRKKFTRN